MLPYIYIGGVRGGGGVRVYIRFVCIKLMKPEALRSAVCFPALWVWGLLLLFGVGGRGGGGAWNKSALSFT